MHVNLPRPPWAKRPAEHHAKLVPFLLNGYALSAKDPASVVWDTSVDNFGQPDSLRFRGDGTIFPMRSGNQHKGEWWARGQTLQVDFRVPKTHIAKTSCLTA